MARWRTAKPTLFIKQFKNSENSHGVVIFLFLYLNLSTYTKAFKTVPKRLVSANKPTN